MKRISLLAMLALVACATNTSGPGAGKPEDRGSIGGGIQYPGHVVPSTRVCALNVETQAATCIKTLAGQSKYLIENLPAANYRVVASIEQWQFKVGGHMQQVQCIRAPCPAMLKAVELKAGQSLVDIDLNGFYLGREDFPEIPVENR